MEFSCGEKAKDLKKITNLDLVISIPECGSATISFLKICGDLGTARTGFNVDILI